MIHFLEGMSLLILNIRESRFCFSVIQAESMKGAAPSQQVSEMQRKNAELQKELNTLKEESSRSQAELARLLQIMSTSEEEKFALNQQISNLQQ